MRHSTQEEKDDYEAMLERKSVVLVSEEFERLKAENARLKAKADVQWSHIEKLQAELSHCIEKSSRDYDRDLDRRRRLATENAKLRELVETMHSDMREMLATIDKGSDTWGYCRYYGECLDAAEGIMRELGIEVGE